ncbi:MAG: hypothetical protein ACFFBP_10340 [Promethearchaeota archaeon]
MLKSKSRVKIGTISLILISIFLLGTCLTIGSATTYQATLNKGTEFFQVIAYNETAWQNTVNASSTPSDWFGGDAHIMGAQGKFTTLGWTSATWTMYDVLTSIFLTDSIDLFALNSIKGIGYNETEINNNYTNQYQLIQGMRSEWYFTIEPFNESSNSATDMPVILSNPADYEKILDDYNALANTIQDDPIIPLDIKMVFKNISTDEFLWQLIMGNLAVGAPSNIYIQALVNALPCDNASFSENTLIFERTGETNYTVEVTYGTRGTISSFVIKDDTGTIIYQYISIGDTNLMVYIIAGVIISCFSILIVVLIYKKRRFNKLNR